MPEKSEEGRETPFGDDPPPGQGETIQHARRKFAFEMLRQRSLALMRLPRQWPHFPFLCLQQLESYDADGFPVVGLLYFDQASNGERHRYTVFLRNLYEIPAFGGTLTLDEFLNGPREEFDSFDAILDAAWEVD